MLAELLGGLALNYLHDDFKNYKETEIKKNQKKNNIITGAVGVTALGALAAYGISRMSQSNNGTNQHTK